MDDWIVQLKLSKSVIVSLVRPNISEAFCWIWSPGKPYADSCLGRPGIAKDASASAGHGKSVPVPLCNSPTRPTA